MRIAQAAGARHAEARRRRHEAEDQSVETLRAEIVAVCSVRWSWRIVTTTTADATAPRTAMRSYQPTVWGAPMTPVSRATPRTLAIELAIRAGERGSFKSTTAITAAITT